MHKCRYSPPESSAPEVLSKISSVAGVGKAVVFGSVAVASWVKRQVPPSDVDILVDRLDLDSHSFKMGLREQGFDGVPSHIGHHEDDFAIYHNGVAHDPVKVHLVLRVGNGGLFDDFLGINTGRFFEHSVIRRIGDGEIRVLDRNMLVLTKWHGCFARNNGIADLEDIRAILAEHYNGSAEEFVDREIDFIARVLGISRANEFIGFMKNLQIGIEAAKSLRA